MTKSKRIILTLATIVITIALATSATFAWFALNTEVFVDGINITIESSEGLTVSVNDTTYDLTVNAAITKTLENVTPKLTTVKYYKDANANGIYDDGTDTEVTDAVNTLMSDYETYMTGRALTYDFFDVSTGKYYQDTDSDGVLNAEADAEVTATVKAYDDTNSCLPARRGFDFDFVVYADADWDTGYEFTTLNGYTLGDALTDSVDNPWITQKVYFSSDIPMRVFLTDILISSVVNGTDTTTPIDIAAGTVDNQDTLINADDSITADIKAAIRIALFDETDTLITVLRYVDGEWEDVAGNGKINMAAYLYNIKTGRISNVLNGVHDYDAIQEDNSAEITESTLWDRNAPIYIGETGDKSSSASEYKTEVTLVIWLEGKDGDCLDSIIDDSAIVSLHFTGDENMD
ncbi:MAG: hypothetical protein PHW00_00945 [Clostridia bacterium]|nr:hypothetical protein [Clostridia bacterium]